VGQALPAALEQTMVGQAVPAALEQTTVGQAVPAAMEVHGGADLHLQPVEGTPRRSRGVPEEGCYPMGSLCWSRLLTGPQTCRERGAHAGAGLLAGLVTPRGTHAGGGAECEEEGAAETCDELTAAPIPHPPVLPGGEEGEKTASEAEPGKKGGVVFVRVFVLFLTILL